MCCIFPCLCRWRSSRFRVSLTFSLYLLRQGLSCNPDWPWAHRSACLYLPSAGINSVCHQTQFSTIIFEKTLPEPRAHCPASSSHHTSAVCWTQGLTLARQALYWLGCFPCQHSTFLKYFLVYETEQKLGNPLLLPHCKTTSLSASCNEGVHLIPSVSQSLGPKFIVYIRTHIWWHPWALRHVCWDASTITVPQRTASVP